MVNIFPRPKEIKTTEHAYAGKKAFFVSGSFRVENESILDGIPMDSAGTPLTLDTDFALSKEEYRLTISRYDISVSAPGERGFRLALATLRQVLKSDIIPCMEIHDYPDFEARGVMVDVSRCKIPQPEALKRLIDLLSDMKYNQFQLYFEGLVFAYKGFENEWKDKNPITPEYLCEIREHCKKRGMELIPFQNGFGHMADWLAIPRLRCLAECENGYDVKMKAFGITLHREPFTLNPLDERSFEFVKQLYEDILPHFESGLLHVGGDECIELGEGKSAEIVKKLGKEKVWVDYMIKLNNMCREFGKTMMCFSDMIINSPEVMDSLPRDLIIADWAGSYEDDAPYEKNCALLRDKGFQFYVLPGTSSWLSYLGRSEIMKRNQLNAAKNGKKYGALGYLLTDWGDGGNAQFPTTSYVPFAYGAGLCWNLEGNKDINNAFEYLDKNLFDCRGFAEFAYDCGNAFLYENHRNPNHIVLLAMQNLYTLFDTPVLAKQNAKSYREMIDFLDNQLKKVKDFHTADEFKNELSTNLMMLRNLAVIAIIILGAEVSDSEFDNLLESIKRINDEYTALWNTKNYEYNVMDFAGKMETFLEELPIIRAGGRKTFAILMNDKFANL